MSDRVASKGCIYTTDSMDFPVFITRVFQLVEVVFYPNRINISWEISDCGSEVSHARGTSF